MSVMGQDVLLLGRQVLQLIVLAPPPLNCTRANRRGAAGRCRTRPRQTTNILFPVEALLHLHLLIIEFT